MLVVLFLMDKMTDVMQMSRTQQRREFHFPEAVKRCQFAKQTITKGGDMFGMCDPPSVFAMQLFDHVPSNPFQSKDAPFAL